MMGTRTLRFASVLLPFALLQVALSEDLKEKEKECTNGKLADLFDLRFHNRFVELLPGEAAEGELLFKPREIHNSFWAQAHPTPLHPAAQLLAYSEAAAELMEMKPGAAKTELFRQFVSGEVLLEGGFAYAHCYGGHQFGDWSGQLGDGRAINLGEVVSGNGTRLELQLKGAGITAFSRSGDGRAVLRSSLREFIGSEYMAAVGVPTSRALSLVACTEPNVVRDQFYDGNHAPEPGAVVLRMAASWVRFGTFELYASRGDWGSVRKLADYVLDNLYPGVTAASGSVTGCKYAALLREVAKRTGTLVARWQAIGFVHGVLNTDNMSILGITIDYGPFAFLDAFDPEFTPNTSDDEARYTYMQQPEIGAWNLERLGGALTGVMEGGEEEVKSKIQSAVQAYVAELTHAYRQSMLGRLRLRAPIPDQEADSLIRGLMGWMASARADYHNTLQAVGAEQQRWRDMAEEGVTREEERAREGEEAGEEASGATARVLGAASTAEGRVGPDEVETLREWMLQYKREVLREVARGWASGSTNEKQKQTQKQEEKEKEKEKEGEELSESRRWGLALAEVLYLPRNYLMHQAIDAAAKGDSGPLERLKRAMLEPHTRVEEGAHEELMAPPPLWAEQRGVRQLSCSS